MCPADIESVFVVTIWLSISITESYLIFTDLLLLILEITKSSKSFDHNILYE